MTRPRSARHLSSHHGIILRRVKRQRACTTISLSSIRRVSWHYVHESSGNSVRDKCTVCVATYRSEDKVGVLRRQLSFCCVLRRSLWESCVEIAVDGTQPEQQRYSRPTLNSRLRSAEDDVNREKYNTEDNTMPYSNSCKIQLHRRTSWKRPCVDIDSSLLGPIVEIASENIFQKMTAKIAFRGL